LRSSKDHPRTIVIIRGFKDFADYTERTSGGAA